MCSRATIGSVCVTFPATTPITAIQSAQVSSRERRNLVQSVSLRWVLRSTPPKKVTVQNRW